ncbi:MAG: inner membrane-spanning protein YciB [Succinivibrio sp.]
MDKQNKQAPLAVRIIEILPAVAFFITYKASSDLVTATIVVVSSCLACALIEYAATRTVSRIQIFTIALVLLFGLPTILLGDPSIIKWKVTVSNLVLAGAIFVFQNLLRKNPFSYLFGREIPLPDDAWRFFGAGWMFFFIFGAALNLVLAFCLPALTGISPEEAEGIWVFYKSFGNGILNALFAVALVLVICKRDPSVLSALSSGQKGKDGGKQG